MSNRFNITLRKRAISHIQITSIELYRNDFIYVWQSKLTKSINNIKWNLHGHQKLRERQTNSISKINQIYK